MNSGSAFGVDFWEIVFGLNDIALIAFDTEGDASHSFS